MGSEQNAGRPKGGSFGPALVVLIVLAVVLGAIGYSLAKLGFIQTIGLAVGYMAGTIFGQAKDIANQQKYSGKLVQDLWKYFVASSSNEHSVAFIFRSLEWGGLLIAGTLVAKLLVG